MFSFLKKVFSLLFDTHQKATKERIRALEKLINVKISDPELFIEALTHRSMVDGKRFKSSNERLEFLGDAVLGFIVGRELYMKFPDKDEGFLTKTRANFVNKNALFETCDRIDLLRLIFIQPDLLNNENFGKKTVSSDALEAIIGAIYIDCGLEAASRFISVNIIQPNLDKQTHLKDENYKSQLLELAQASKYEIPKYYVLLEEGPEHDRLFTIEVRLGERRVGTGQGKSKKMAEQNAALQALQLMKTPDFSTRLN